MASVSLDEEILFVLTPQGPARVRRDAGVGPLVFDEKRARRCRYVAVAQTLDRPGEGPRVEHLKAFLIAKVAAIVEADEQPARGPTRWFVRFAETAEIEIENAWRGSRNPVRYLRMAEFPLEFSKVRFRQVGGDVDFRRKNVLEMARKMIAEALGCEPAAITIALKLEAAGGPVR